MIPQGLAGPLRSSQCAESCLEMLSMEVVHYYARQDLVPAAAAIEQIGALLAQELSPLMCIAFHRQSGLGSTADSATLQASGSDASL